MFQPNKTHQEQKHPKDKMWLQVQTPLQPQQPQQQMHRITRALHCSQTEELLRVRRLQQQIKCRKKLLWRNCQRRIRISGGCLNKKWINRVYRKRIRMEVFRVPSSSQVILGTRPMPMPFRIWWGFLGTRWKEWYRIKMLLLDWVAAHTSNQIWVT